MSSIPTNLVRVPTTLASNVFLNNLTRTNVQLLNTQSQLAIGRRITRPSDDAVGASLITVLDEAIERRQQTLRNLDQALTMINTADFEIQTATDMALAAKDIAISMIGPTVDEETRRNQAEVLDVMLDELVTLANREMNDVFLFGGRRTGNAPMAGLLGGFRFLGDRDGMALDLDISEDLEVTLSANRVFGTLSQRVVGDRDLDANLTGDVRINDLNGARGVGVSRGILEIDTNGSGLIEVDLTKIDSVQDVIDAIENAIAEFESTNGVTLLGSGRVGITSDAKGLNLDVASGVTLTFRDIATGVTAADLGLDVAGGFTDGSEDGLDLDPRLTWLTPIDALDGVSPIADFVIANGNQVRVIEASTAESLQDLRSLVEQADIGVRVELDEDGQRIRMVNELSGGSMQIYEQGSGNTAETLGVRTLSTSTRLSEFNNGRGVSILSGNVDAFTGDPDPLLDRDFSITLSDGTTFDVDLAGAETVQDVLDIVRSAAPVNFSISVDPGSGGFILRDLSSGSGEFGITRLNGSFAADDLGLMLDANGAEIAGEDRAKVEVEGIFAHLIELRDALIANDERGITFAGEMLEEDIDRLVQSRAVLGQRANRVSASQRRTEDVQLMDEGFRSRLRDLDYADASVRFTTLQTQLQAAMLTGSRANSLSLINFLR